MHGLALKVFTYNIHKGFNVGNRRFVLHQIREALAGVDADLVFLQETQGKHLQHEALISDWPNSTQYEFLAEGIWPHYAYGKNAIYSAGNHGNAILSKYPLESWENINVSPFRWASRSLLHAVLTIAPGKPRLHTVCIHFGLTSSERRRQLDTMCKRIDSHVPHDEPLIVAGDFNDWLGRSERYFHEHLGLQEIFRTLHGRYALSFPAWMPVFPMDRIYYRGLQPVSCARLGHTPWRVLSDHAPLSAAFRL